MRRNGEGSAQAMLRHHRENELLYLIQTAMKITPEIETYFLSLTLVFGIQRIADEQLNEPDKLQVRYRQFLEVAGIMSKWTHQPEFLMKLKRAYQEAGSVDGSWFYGQLAEAYLQWLYSAPTEEKTG